MAVKRITIKILCSLVVLITLLTGCNTWLEEDLADAASGATDATTGNAKIHEEAADYSWDESKVIQVLLNGNPVVENSAAIIVSGSMITLASAGTYLFAGTLFHIESIDGTSVLTFKPVKKI